MPITRDAYYYDHLRDERKHEPRPTDPLPLRLEPAPISGALEIAILAKSVPLQAAADLIDQYARTCAAAARLDATAYAIDRCCDAIESGARS
jgi:hypothetical protein